MKSGSSTLIVKEHEKIRKRDRNLAKSKKALGDGDKVLLGSLKVSPDL